MTDVAKERWPPYHWLESPEIQPTVDEFWRAKFGDMDLVMYNRFIEILRLSNGGVNGESIRKSLGINNVRKYVTGNKMSFLTHLRAELDRLGPPRPRHKWLPLRLKARGTPGRDWVEVPLSPIRFADVQSLVDGLIPAPVEPEVLANFGFHSDAELESERINLFGFLLGAVVGDSGKHIKGTKRFASRSLSLVLSHNKPNSFRFGEFTSFCANESLNLGMHRINDLPISSKRYGKTGYYAWISASSPIISWIFNDCLGLRDGETTTYDSLRMDWILDSPQDFSTHFIQGLAESDGWPDAGSDVVKVVSSPNTDLFKHMFDNLGCPSQVVNQPPVELILCPTENAANLPFFSPRVHSNLYEDMQTLARASRYPERVHLPQSTVDLIRELSKATSNANEVCLKLAKKIGYKISDDTVRKYSKS